MDKRQQHALGAVLIAAGIGAGGYLFDQYRKGRVGRAYLRNVVITIDPPPPLAAGVQEVALTISVDNPAGHLVTYAAQAATLENDIVTGHWWSSPDIARTAGYRYNAGDVDGYEQLAVNPLWRLPQVPIGPGQRGQITLYGVINVHLDELWCFWVQPAPDARLLAADPLAQHLTGLPGMQYIARM